MANIFLSLPMPVGNGSGAPVDVSAMGSEKSIVIGGSFVGASVAIEVSTDGGTTFLPIWLFTTASKKVIPVAAQFMRVFVSGRSAQPFSAAVNIGANDSGALFVGLPLPVGNGAGAPINTTLLGNFTTFVIGGQFKGAAIEVQISEDGVNYSTCVNFPDPGVQSRVVVANFMRTFVKGRAGNTNPFTPTVGVGATVDAGGGGAVVVNGSAPNCLIYQQGGVETGPVIFNDFNDLYAQLLVLRATANGGGCYTIEFDMRLVGSVCTVPVGTLGTYDLTDVTLDGGLIGGNANFDDGVTVTGLRHVTNSLSIQNQNTLVPLEVMPATSVGIITVEKGSVLQTINGGTQPFFDVVTNATDFVQVKLLSGARLGFTGNGVLFNPFQVGTFLGIVVNDPNPIQPPLGGSTRPNMIQGVVGALMSIQTDGLKQVSMLAGVASSAFPSWLGTVFTPQVINPAGLVPTPFQLPPSTAAIVTPAIGTAIRLNAAAGIISQLLPRISASTNRLTFPGGLQSIVETSGINGVTMTPAAGDTVNGSAAARSIAPGGGMLLQSDGISNWEIIATYNPANGTRLVYDTTSAETGPVIFNNWDSLYTQLQLIRAASGGKIPVDVYVQTNIVQIVPVTGTTYDMGNVTLQGFGIPSVFSTLEFAAGSSVIDMLTFKNGIIVRHRNTVAPLCTLSVGFGNAQVSNFSSIESLNGGAAFYDLTGMQGIRIDCFQFSGTNIDTTGSGFTTGPIITPAQAGQFLQLSSSAVNASRPPFRNTATVFPGVVGSLLGISTENFLGVPGAFLGWAGTVFTPTFSGTAGLLTNPYRVAPAVAPVSAIQGSMLRFNASGGPIAQTLPRISTAVYPLFQNSGGFFTVVEYGGGNVTLAPFAGDTINGAASLAVPPNGAVLLESDGISAWRIIAIFNPTFAPPSELVYQPGGTGVGPVVFADWTALNTQLALIKSVWGNAQLDLVFDNSITSPIAIPVGGPYNMARVTWTGKSPQGLGGLISVNIPEGVTFTGLRDIEGNLRVTNQATATVPDVSLAHLDRITIKGGASVESTALVPLWRGTGLAPGNRIDVDIEERGALGLFGVPTAPIVDVFVAGLLIATSYDTGFFRENTLAGPIGATLSITPVGDTARARSSQALFLGTIFQIVSQFPRPIIDTALIATTPNSLSVARLARYNTTAGNIVSNLPGAASTTVFRGDTITVKNEVGGNYVLVTPAGADTIDGVAAALVLAPGQSAILSTNGGTNWTALVSGGSGVGCYNVTGPFVFPAGGAAAVGDLAQVDVSGGVVPMTLPAISANNSGCKVVLKKIAGGGAAMTATPAGANTIEGAAGATAFGGALASVTLVSDGVSNWMVI